MKEPEFKKLSKGIVGHWVETWGTKVGKGYKPDLTLKNKDGLSFIVENENKADRKAFLGAFIKAEKYCECARLSPSLLIVMKEWKNTTVKQITNNLRPYVKWLRSIRQGKLALKQILIISDKDFKNAIKAKKELDSDNFRRKCRKIRG